MTLPFGLTVHQSPDGRWWSQCYAGNHNQSCRTFGHDEHWTDDLGIVWYENTEAVQQAMAYRAAVLKGAS